MAGAARLEGPFHKVKALRRSVLDLADPKGSVQRDVALAAKNEVRRQLREQFARGEGAYGPLTPRKDGRPALVSRKLPQDFAAAVLPGGELRVRVSRAWWLRGHQEGHTFAPRTAGGQVLTFDKNGRILRQSRIPKQKFVFERRAREHSIGQRVLPARPMIPVAGKGFPLSWATRINAAARVVIARWTRRSTR